MWILIRQLIFAEEIEDPIHHYQIQAWIAERINDTALARVPGLVGPIQQELYNSCLASKASVMSILAQDANHIPDNSLS